jgi:N4-gp56 family major capsid protein
MGWYDDWGAGTYATKTTTVGGGQNTYYDKKFLDVVKQQLKLIPFGQRRPLPMGEGKTIQFFRWLNIAVSVSGATLSEGVNPNATQLTGQDLTATLAEYGGFSQITSLMRQTHIDGNLSRGIGSAVELWGEHGANILDRLCHMEVCSAGAMPLRADYAGDTGATFTGIMDDADSTHFQDAALQTNSDYGDADDDLNQSLITMTGGTSYGQQRVVTDYDESGGALGNGYGTVSPAWDKTPVAGDTYSVTTPDGIASGDKLTYANIKRAVTRLKQYRAPFFTGGFYVGLIDPGAAELLRDDTNWINAHTYKEVPKGLFDGEVGKFAGVRFIEETDPFIFPIESRGTAGTAGGPGVAGANFSSTGDVTSNLILGQHAFGVTTMKNKMGQIRKPPIIIKTSGPQDTSNPLNRYGTVGWAIEAVYKSLNPLFAQQIWTFSNAAP